MIRRHRQILTALLVSLSACVVRAAVTVEGLLAEDLEKLRRTYPDLQTLNPSPRELDDLIRAIGTTENYRSVNAYRDSAGNYVIQAEPLKRIAEIRVRGNDVVDETEVLNAIGLKSGQLFDGGRMALAGEALQELYGKNGYFNATIKFSYTESQQNALLLMVDINEGKPCLISKVVVESANPNLASRLERVLRRYRGREFSEAQIVDLEKRANDYLREERYLNARIQQKEALYNEAKTSATLYYVATDPYSYDVVFDGNHAESTGELLRVLDLDNFDRASLDPAADIGQKIRNHYISKGYAHSRVSHDVKVYEKTFLRQVRVSIEEGPRAKLKDILVSGRISRAPEFYANFIRKNSSDKIEEGYFVRRDLEEGYKNLIVQLNNEGFLRAKLQSARVEFTKDKKLATVEVVLDEGPLTQLRRISFVGNKRYPERELLKVMKIKPNSPLHLNDLEQSIDQLRRFYLDRGHLEMRLENQDDELVQYDEKGAVANIVFRIHEGPSISIGDIQIEGNTFTKNEVILRQIELEVGELLTPEKLDEAEKRLERLEIFSQVDVSLLDANTDKERRTLFIKVTEDLPGTFRVGFGANNERELTLRGYTRISYNNLGGTARVVSAHANVQNNIVNHRYTEYEAGISYLEPFLLDSRFRGRVALSRQERVDDYDSTGNDWLLIRRTDDLNFNVERDLTSNIRFGWRLWGIETVKYFYARETLDPANESKQQIATMGPLIDIDFRDNPLNPTRGTFTRFEADYSSDQFGSSRKIHFVRTQGTFSHFLRVFTPKVIWANSFSAGWERNLSHRANSGVPLSYAFFLGGYSTIRGFSGSINDRTPSDREFDNDYNQKLVVPGEAKYYLVRSELRFPIWGIVGGVLFYDGGEVEVQHRFDRGMEQSYGGGIRINTPVGPFSLDYGRKFSRDRTINESPDHWHLYFGTF